ncbi:unnamed protein product, partial [Vitis vinifera]|uniref:Uncharacterized protein n=1 Tax=Vitis vinifera TaxID=29760 RepID=D7TF77_VITVI
MLGCLSIIVHQPC